MRVRFKLCGRQVSTEGLIRDATSQPEGWDLKPGDTVHFEVGFHQVPGLRTAATILRDYFAGFGWRFTWEAI